LRQHSPRELKVFETWDIFKQKFDEYNQKQLSIGTKVVKQIRSETPIPVTSKSQEVGIYYPHFVEAVCRDANDLARNAKPYYRNLIEENKPTVRAKTWEFWPGGDLFARGTEDLVEKAKKYMLTFLNRLEENSYTRIAGDLIKDEEELNELRKEVTRKIKDLIAIPIFPGKCIYIKRAVPGVYERIKNLFSRWFRRIRRAFLV